MRLLSIQQANAVSGAEMSKAYCSVCYGKDAGEANGPKLSRLRAIAIRQYYAACLSAALRDSQ